MPFNVTSHISWDFHTPKELLKTADVTVSQLYEWNAKENPNYPLFVYHDGTKLEYVTYSAANRAIDRVARYIATNVGLSGADRSLPRVVALFANAGAYANV